MRKYWVWIGAMALVAAGGSWLVRTIAFAMQADATPGRYGGFTLGLSLPIPVVQIAPHWNAILALWAVFAVLGLCGWRAVRALGDAQTQALWPVYAGYAVVASVLTFFAVTLSIDGYFYTVFARLFGVYGIDPYVFVSPIHVADPVLLQDFSLLDNPPFPDPYGPGFTLLAGLVGRLEMGASLWTQLWTWRVIAVAACLLIIAALARILRHTGPPERARRLAVFALHPLTLYESGVGGHNDFLMCAAAVWAYALVDELPLIAGLLLGAAISIKYFAAVLVPFVALRAWRSSRIAALLIVVLAALVPLLCFHPFAFGVAGQTTLVKVGSSLSMSLNWLLALPLFALQAGDRTIRGLQLAIAAIFALITFVAIARYARRSDHGDVFRSIAALLWSLPAMHPWYAIWLVPAAAARGAWATYAWWFGALSLLVYAHEAVLPTPANHSIFIALTIVMLGAPILIARAAANAAPRTENAAREPRG
jgi:alpha-1,6-mannosyltransferase